MPFDTSAGVRCSRVEASRSKVSVCARSCLIAFPLHAFDHGAQVFRMHPRLSGGTVPVANAGRIWSTVQASTRRREWSTYIQMAVHAINLLTLRPCKECRRPKLALERANAPTKPLIHVHFFALTHMHLQAGITSAAASSLGWPPSSWGWTWQCCHR